MSKSINIVEDYESLGDEEDFLYMMYEELDYTIEEIYRHVNLCYSTLHKRMHEYDINIRSNRGNGLKSYFEKREVNDYKYHSDIEEYKKWRKKFQRLDDYKKFREVVKKRDEYKCVLCRKERNPQVHHILKVRDLVKENRYNFITNSINGVTLCRTCHDHVTNKEDEFEKDFFEYTVRK